MLCRDLQFAQGYFGRNEPVYLVLSEMPPQKPRQRRRRLTATLALASGNFSVEARYGSGVAHIVGVISPAERNTPSPDDTAGHKRSVRRTGARRIRDQG